MAEIIEERRYETRVTYTLECTDRSGQTTCGFSFPCDAQGNVPADLNPDARRNLEVARDETRYTPLRVVRYERHTVVPAILQCDCGATFHLGTHGADASCPVCGAEYNTAGQRLASRALWGEETGETAADYDAGLSEGDEL